MNKPEKTSNLSDKSAIKLHIRVLQSFDDVKFNGLSLFSCCFVVVVVVFFFWGGVGRGWECF